MISFLKSAIIFFVGICFSLAVLEIDVEGYDHTFFDPCDTYIQSIGSQAEVACKKVETKKPLNLVFEYKTSSYFPDQKERKKAHSDSLSKARLPRRFIFLETRSLLI